MARLPIRPSRRLGLNATPSMPAPEAASEDCLKGALVVLNASGYVEEAGTDPVDIAGVADEPGHADASAGLHTLGYTPVNANIIFEASVDDSGDLGNGTCEQTDVGEKFGVTKDADGVWYIDKAKTDPSVQRVFVEKLKDPAGTVQGRVYFRFLE